MMNNSNNHNKSYVSGNFAKYHTGNPLKKYFLNKFLLNLTGILCEHCTGEDKAATLSLLDMGCGEGMIAGQLARLFPGFSITGADASEQAIKKAREINDSKIDFMVANIYDNNFTADKFDIVICLEVLEHLEKPAAALQNVYDKTQTHLIVSVPHEPYFRLGNLLSLKNVKALGNPEDHIQHWTHNQFKKMIVSELGGNCLFFTSFPWSIAYIYK